MEKFGSLCNASMSFSSISIYLTKNWSEEKPANNGVLTGFR